MVLLISYDLDHHARPAAYAAVEKMIKENSRSWAKPLYSQWFVDTGDSIETWQTRMKNVADGAADYWLILPVTSSRQGWLGKEVWSWLNARL
jgi:hypothetical protein